MWVITEGITCIENKYPGSSADRSELDNLKLSGKGKLENLACEVKLEGNLGLQLHQRFIKEITGLKYYTAGQFDKERLGLCYDCKGLL